MNQGYENAHAALKMWGEADAAGDTRLKNLAYDNFIRAKRLIDAEEFDKEIYDDFGNLCKPAGEMSEYHHTRTHGNTNCQRISQSFKSAWRGY